MRKIVIGFGLAGLLLVAANTGAQALPVAPLSQATIAAMSGVSPASWRHCWRDRWGRVHCRRCWRDRWGRVRCR